MNHTSRKFLKAIPVILILLTALACPAFSEDIQTLIRNAEGGDPKAQFNLGVAYERGQVVPQDYAESMKWHRMAASRDLPRPKTTSVSHTKKDRAFRRTTLNR